MADDPLAMTRDALSRAQAALANALGGNNVAAQTQQAAAELQTAQAQLQIATRERSDLLAQGAKAQADLDAANKQLAETGRQVDGKPLPPGTYVSAKSALGMALVGTVLGVGGGVLATKLIDKSAEKKKLEQNGKATLNGSTKEKSA